MNWMRTCCSHKTNKSKAWWTNIPTKDFSSKKRTNAHSHEVVDISHCTLWTACLELASATMLTDTLSQSCIKQRPWLSNRKCSRLLET